ncbi:MAG TPA: response regulator [Bryobacteraceae bacterium]|jgi:DNA-binding response OmpR family regulator
MKNFPTSTMVLVVDDEEADRSEMREVLKAAGYPIVEAANCEEAIAISSRNKSIGFLVADISLPDGDGCDLALRLHADNSELRVLFVSGHVGAEVCRFYGLDIRDVHFLRKPFSGEMLLSRVREIGQSVEPFPARITAHSGRGSGGETATMPRG